MEELKGNSFASQEVKAEKKVQPITSDVIVKKENSLAKKFFAQDLKSTGNNIVNETIIPGMKRIISDIVKRSIDFLLYGTYNSYSDGRNDYSKISTRNITTLTQIGSNGREPAPQQNYSRQNDVIAVNDVLFNDRGVAEEVLLQLQNIIKQYGMVSVADFYETINQSTAFTTAKYGWKDLSSAYVQRLIDGHYRIVFPKVIVLD